MARLWLGWSQSELKVGNGESPQKLPAALRCVHVSFVYLTSRLTFFVMLMSPRILSWRVLIGSNNDETQFVEPVVLGSGNTFKIARPAGLRLAAGILLPGKVSREKGSCVIGSISAPLKSLILLIALVTLLEFIRQPHSSHQ